ncbi:MAG: STAS domain-containing protein [Anaerolineales bacterium]
MDMKISSENERVQVTLIHIDGNLDAGSYREFQEKTQYLIKDGARYILIDLEHSPFVSSAGFRAIHQLFKDLNAVHDESNISEEDMKQGISAGSYKSPYLKLVNLSADTKAVFKTTGFDMYLECHDDLKTALASF